MATFKKAVSFNAWQFNVAKEDLALEDWAFEEKHENSVCEALGLNLRKFRLIDNDEEDTNRRTRFPSRFRLTIEEYSYTDPYSNNEIRGYYELNEGEWLIESGTSKGLVVVSDDELKAIILP